MRDVLLRCLNKRKNFKPLLNVYFSWKKKEQHPWIKTWTRFFWNRNHSLVKLSTTYIPPDQKRTARNQNRVLFIQGRNKIKDEKPALWSPIEQPSLKFRSVLRFAIYIFIYVLYIHVYIHPISARLCLYRGSIQNTWTPK